MLSGFVNKYINERVSFNTSCFGLTEPRKSTLTLDGPDQKMEISLVDSRTGTANGVRFPTKSNQVEYAMWG